MLAATPPWRGRDGSLGSGSCEPGTPRRSPPCPSPRPPWRCTTRRAGDSSSRAPEGAARLYVCGITPYDATHIGHAATYVGFDLLYRAWRNAGHDVTYVQNVTDVDDPLLERATKVNVDWVELAQRETELFRQDMQALRVLPPAHYIGAVESIPLVVAMIEDLDAAGAIYRVEDDLYYSVARGRGLRLPSPATTATRCCGSSPSAGETPTAPASATRWTAWSGAASVTASRRGPARSDPVAPAGTSSVPRSPASTWAAASTSRAAGSDLVFPHHEMCAGPRPGRRARYLLREDLQPCRDGRLRRREDVEVARQPGLRLRAAQQRHRPDGHPARAAAPPLPQ